MNLEQVDHLLGEIRERQGIDRFVVLGSLSVLGMVASHAIPEEMLFSNELDGYPEDDPDRRQEVARLFGQGTRFERENGYYFDPVAPALPTLPEGWRGRLIEVRLPSGARAKFLEPNDAAVSKYARGAPKDRTWIRAGLAASILSAATIEYRFRDTPFLDRQEHERAKAALSEDMAWMRGKVGARARRRLPPGGNPRKP